MDIETSCAKKFGWTEIPFEPLGVDTGKYPIVRAEDFDDLQKAAKFAKQEKKFDIKLLRAPQGAGKTALSNEIKNSFLKDPESFVIFHQLINMKPSDLTRQIIDQAIQNNIVTNDFVSSIGFSKEKDFTNTELKEIIIKIFEKSIENKNLGLWIVDEFDTISSSESSEGEKSEFLQWLRSIIDAIANSKIIHGKGFLMIMAHTEKSAEEFGQELKNLHGPLQERLMGTGTIEIGYTLQEVKKIVQGRLDSVRIDKKNQSIEPFTEEAINSLYERVNYQTGTREMISFRLFEKTCYKAIVNAYESNQLLIDVNRIEKAFQEIQRTLIKENTISNISHDTMMDVSKILRADENAQNTTILTGIGAGITNFMSAVLEDVQTLGSKSTEVTESGLHINEIRFMTELKLKKSTVSSIWYCVSKEKESFVEEDFEIIENKLESLKNDRIGINLTILCIVTDKEDIPLNEEFVKKHVKSIDELFLIDKKLKNDLITIGCCNINEISDLQQPFDRHIRSKFTDLLSSQRNITFRSSDGVRMLIKMLNLLDSINEDVTGPRLQNETGLFFGRTKPVPKAVKDLIQLGFAKESNDNLIPEIPQSLQHVLDLVKINDHKTLEHIPNKDIIISTAKDLDLINKEDNLIKFEDVEKQIADSIQECKQILEKSPDEDSKIINDLRKLVQSYNNLELITNQTRKLLLIQFINSEIKSRLKAIERNESTTTTTSKSIIEDESTFSNSDEGSDEDQDADVLETKEYKKADNVESILEDVQEVMSTGSMKLSELIKKLQNKGYPPEIRQKLFFMVKNGNLRVTL